MKPIASLEMLVLQVITNDCLISQSTCTSFPRSETNEGKEELQLNLVNNGIFKNKFKDSVDSHCGWHSTKTYVEVRQYVDLEIRNR